MPPKLNPRLFGPFITLSVISNTTAKLDLSARMRTKRLDYDYHVRLLKHLTPHNGSKKPAPIHLTGATKRFMKNQYEIMETKKQNTVPSLVEKVLK